MTAFADALSTLCLTQEDATNVLPSRDPAIAPKLQLIKDWARGKTRVPDDVWHRLGDLFEAVEQAADHIISDQGERDAGDAALPLVVDVAAIGLPHPSLRRAAFVRARLVLGPHLVREAK